MAWMTPWFDTWTVSDEWVGIVLGTSTDASFNMWPKWISLMCWPGSSGMCCFSCVMVMYGSWVGITTWISWCVLDNRTITDQGPSMSCCLIIVLFVCGGGGGATGTLVTATSDLVKRSDSSSMTGFFSGSAAVPSGSSPMLGGGDELARQWEGSALLSNVSEGALVTTMGAAKNRHKYLYLLIMLLSNYKTWYMTVADVLNSFVRWRMTASHFILVFNIYRIEMNK